MAKVTKASLDADFTKGVEVKEVASEKKAKQGNKRGVVYLGHVPHGFYEREMRSFFKQFGDVTRLRVSRNKQGKSRHYAFVEFKSKEVAQIVAKSMNNYMLGDRVIDCKVVDDPHKSLFVGCNKVKAIHNHPKKNRVRHNRPKTRAETLQSLRRTHVALTRSIEAISAAGIEYTFDVESALVGKNVKAISDDVPACVSKWEEDLKTTKEVSTGNVSNRARRKAAKMKGKRKTHEAKLEQAATEEVIRMAIMAQQPIPEELLAKALPETRRKLGLSVDGDLGVDIEGESDDEDQILVAADLEDGPIPEPVVAAEPVVAPEPVVVAPVVVAPVVEEDKRSAGKARKTPTKAKKTKKSAASTARPPMSRRAASTAADVPVTPRRSIRIRSRSPAPASSTPAPASVTSTPRRRTRRTKK